MFNLGARQSPPLVDRVPFIPMLKENNARKGFFEHEEFLALHSALPPYLKGFATFGYRVGRLLPYVFLNRFATERLKRFDKEWKKACRDSKIGVRIFHDFRRTAVRNMVRSGVPERVAMMVSEHKTRSVFDRYNIVSDHDLKLAAAKHAAYLDALHGHNLGTVGHFGTPQGGRTDT